MRISRSLWKNAYYPVNVEGVCVRNFDPGFPIEVNFDVHDSHYSVCTNRHDSFEVIYVYEGEGFAKVRDRRFSITRGHLVVVGPNLYHQFICGPHAKLKLACIDFHSGIMLGSTSGEEEQYLAPFLCQDEEFPHVIPPSTGIPDEVLRLILKIQKELPPASEMSRLTVKTYLKVLLLLLLRHYHKYVGTYKALERRQRDVQRLAPLFQFINQRYSQSIRTAEAARLCAMSKVQFMRFFKKITGQSFLNYLKRFRVAKAQSLLTTTDISIAEISGLMGFCSQSHFGRTFSSLVGFTPLAYRSHFGEFRGRNVDGMVQSGEQKYKSAFSNRSGARAT